MDNAVRHISRQEAALIHLHDFEKDVYAVILQRGSEYYHEGCVLSVEEVDDFYYEAEVEGSDIYEVRVRIESGDRIISWYCDCPFEGSLCKHAVAVFYELRDLRAKAAQNQTAARSVKRSLTEQLASLNKEQLIELLVTYARDIKEVRTRLDLHFTKPSQGEELRLQPYINLIHTYVKKYSDRGFIEYGQEDGAILGAQEVLEEALEAEDQGNLKAAWQIGRCMLGELVNIYQNCDDSNGTVAALIGEGLELLARVVQSKDRFSAVEKRQWLRELLSDATMPNWSDWREELLQFSVELVEDQETRRLWEQDVRRLEALGGSSSGRSYLAERIAEARHRLITQFDGEEAAANFLKANMELAEVREKAIQQAISQRRYEEALKYAIEGEQLDTQRNHPVLVSQWKKLRLKVYVMAGERELQRQITEEFAMDGEYEYYRELKGLYTDKEWPAVYNRVLTHLETVRGWKTADLYFRVLVEEKETEKLLACVKRNPELVTKYYDHLVKKHPDDVYALFEHVITENMKRATTRKQYQEICGTIRLLVKAEGRQTAAQIIGDFKQQYAKRAALIEELDRLSKALGLAAADGRSRSNE